MRRALKYIVTLILIGLLFLGVVWFYSTKTESSYISPTIPVSVIKPEYRVIKENYSVTGYIEAESMVPVVPFVSGTITEYYAENDMEVKKDQILAVIDTEPYELQLKQAEAAYLAYDATFNRVSALYEQGAATKQNYDEVKAQRDATKAQYELAQLQLSYCYVDSPIDGTVLLSKGSVGSIGTSDSPVAVVADLDNLIVNVTVPEKYYYDIYSNKDTLSTTVTRKINGKEYSASASLVSVSPYVDPTTKTFNLKVKLEGDVSFFKPGMMVTVDVIYREENVLSLPQEVKKLDGSVYAIQKDNEGTYRAKYYSLPTLSGDDEYFQVDESFRDTEFIYRGQTKVLDKQPVTIVEGY